MQCEVSPVISNLGCHTISWCWSAVLFYVQSQHCHLSGDFRTLHASVCWQSVWWWWFQFPAGLSTSHSAKLWATSLLPMVLLCMIRQLLVWPEHPNLCGIVKRKMRDTTPNNNDLKGTTTTIATWGSITHQYCHKGWLPPCHAASMQEFVWFTFWIYSCIINLSVLFLFFYLYFSRNNPIQI